MSRKNLVAYSIKIQDRPICGSSLFARNAQDKLHFGLVEKEGQGSFFILVGKDLVQQMQ